MRLSETKKETTTTTSSEFAYFPKTYVSKIINPHSGRFVTFPKDEMYEIGEEFFFDENENLVYEFNVDWKVITITVPARYVESVNVETITKKTFKIVK